jgi:hypothetical protein
MTKEDLAFIRALRDKGVEVTFSQPNKTVDSFYENPAAMGSNASYPYRTLQDPSYGDIRIDPPQSHDPNTIQELRLEKRLRPTNITPEMMQGGSVESNEEFLNDLKFAEKRGGLFLEGFRNRLIKEPGTTVTLPDSTYYDDAQKLLDYVNESKVFAAGDTANYNANVDILNKLIQNSLIQNQEDHYAGKLNPISTTPTTDYESAQKLRSDIIDAGGEVVSGFKTGKAHGTQSLSHIHTDYPFTRNPDGSYDSYSSPFALAKAKLQGTDLRNKIPVFVPDFTKFDYIEDPALYDIKVESPKKTTEVKKKESSTPKKEEVKTMAVPRMEVEKRPTTDIKGPWGIMSKEDFIDRYGQKVWDEQNRTPELQGGEVEATADNTAVNFVNPFLEQELYRQNQAIAAEELRRAKAENPGVIKEFVPPSATEKALNIAANPVQAFGYSVRGQDMPMGLLPNSDNLIDMALDMVNPAAWANYGVEAGKSAVQGDALGAGLNLLGAVPGVKMPGLTLGSNTLVKPVVNKIQPIVKTGLDDMTDMLTTVPSAIKRDFGNLKFDVKNKVLPEKISANNVSNKAIKGQSVDGLGYDRFDQSLGGRVSKHSVDNELFRTSARTLGQKYFDPSVIDLLENLNNYGDVSKAVMLSHKLNLADLGQMRRFNTRPLDLTVGGEYTNFLNTQKLSPNFTASDELLADFYTRGYDKFFNSPTNPIRKDYIARALERNPGVRNPSPRELGLLWEGFDRFYKDARGRLESSILKTKLNKPTSLFRLEGENFPVTVRRDGKTYATNYSDMQVGDILLPDNRFKSTSYDKPAYFGTMGSVINAPAGQSVLVPNITGVRNYTNELEALLPPQLEFQVKQISDRLPYFEKGKLKNMMLEKSYAFDIVNPYKEGGVEKMKQGGMERQKFSKEDLAFMRALRDQGVEVTFSNEGYRDDSPDRNNSVNVIDTKGTGRISMNNNDGTPIQNTPRILAITDRGQSKVLESGNEYKLDGNKVLEIPMAQSGMVENGVPLLQSGISNEQAIQMANSGISQGYQDYTSSNMTALDKTKSGVGGAGSAGGSMEAGTGFGMSDALAIGSGISNISKSLGALGPESSTEVGSVSGMGGSREQAVEGTIGGVMSSIPVVGQFYQIGAGIGSGFEAGANAFYEQGNETGGEAMTALQGVFNPSSQWGRNAELWEAGYLSDAQAVGNLFAPFIGGVMMDRKVRDIKSNRFTAQSARATGGLHTTPSPSAESAGKFSKATGYPKPKRT